MSSKLDQIYRSLIFSKYFTKGWGEPENLKRICDFRKTVANRETCYKLVSPDYPVHIEKEVDNGNYYIYDGYFFSPFAHYLPEVVPNKCQTAYFQLVLPKKWASETFKPVVLQIAGTGDQFYWRRRNLIAKPLIKEAGIGSIILENPFYGLRKPVEQIRTVLHNVSDIFVMGGCLMLEALVIFHLCERLGLGPLGVTGLSMGGHMASLASTCWPKPLVVVPCLSGLTASNVFTQGVISRALNWNMLEEQFRSNVRFKEDILKKIENSAGDAFKAGQEFVKTITDTARNNLSSINVEENLGSSNFINYHPKNQISDNFNKRDFDSVNLFEINSSHKSNSKIENLKRNRNLSFGKKLENYETLIMSANTKDENTIGNTYPENKSDLKSDINQRLLNSLLEFAKGSVNINFLSRKQNHTTDVDSSLSVHQAFYFMNGIMDELTHLKNYAVPYDTSLVIAVSADYDAYIPNRELSHLNEIWPNAEVRFVRGGHVRAYVQYQKEFRQAIIDGFAKYRSKYAHL